MTEQLELPWTSLNPSDLGRRGEWLEPEPRAEHRYEMLTAALEDHGVRRQDSAYLLRRLDPDVPSRWEEYTWMLKNTPPVPDSKRWLWRAVCLGAGYVPKWHIEPELLALVGYQVTAVDIDMRAQDMPHDPHVVRLLADASRTGLPTGGFRVVTCISVLEHLSYGKRLDVLREARGLRKLHEGRILITMDGHGGPVFPMGYGVAAEVME